MNTESQKNKTPTANHGKITASSTTTTTSETVKVIDENQPAHEQSSNSIKASQEKPSSIETSNAIGKLISGNLLLAIAFFLHSKSTPHNAPAQGMSGLIIAPFLIFSIITFFSGIIFLIKGIAVLVKLFRNKKP